jgi:hypothetical protein
LNQGPALARQMLNHLTYSGSPEFIIPYKMHMIILQNTVMSKIRNQFHDAGLHRNFTRN